MKRFTFFHLCVAFLVMLATRAHGADYSLQVALVYDDPNQPFVWKTDISESVLGEFQSDRQAAVRPYLDKAKKKLAKERGYSKAEYGPDYWKTIQVSKWYFTIQDKQSYEVIMTNREAHRSATPHPSERHP